MCGPRQLFFFQCGPETPKGWAPLNVFAGLIAACFGGPGNATLRTPETEAGHRDLHCEGLFLMPFLLSFPDVPFSFPPTLSQFILFWKTDSFPWLKKKKKVRSRFPSSQSLSCWQPRLLGSGGYFQRYFMQIQANTNLKILFLFF